MGSWGGVHGVLGEHPTSRRCPLAAERRWRQTVLAWLSPDGSASAQRTEVLSNGSRPYTLHDLVTTDTSVEAYGFSDGPMTHSADGNDIPAKTFGPLVVRVVGD
jgi:hypothetical protein